MVVKFLLSFSASASPFAPSTPILFPSKVMTKQNNYRLTIAIINKNINFVWNIKEEVNKQEERRKEEEK